MSIQRVFEQGELRDDQAALPEAVGLLHPVPHRIRQQDHGRLYLQLLGSPQLALAGRPVVSRTRKMLALVAYLALQGGRQSREHLADLFWPEADVEDARASLRTTLSYVRQALGSETDTYLVTTRDFVELQLAAPLELDVERLAEAQRLVRHSPDSRILRRQLEAAVALYHGPLLEGLSLPDAPDFEAWLEGQRAHWHRIAAALLEHLAALQFEDGDAGAAISSLEQWTAMDPDDELAWKQLIGLHLRCEDWSGARRAWKGYRAVLDELGAEPSPEILALAGRVDAGTAASVPAPADTPLRWGSLDVRALPFVGRSREWAELLAAFERTRKGEPEIVVVEAAAGLGKTRLISQFSAWAKGEGADVLVGRALDTFGDLPYAAVVDALRGRLDRENAPDDLLCDLWLGELARLLPELRERYPDLPVPQDDPYLGRGRLFEAVARLGQALAGRMPMVLCVDDVQWMDLGTRDLLCYAMRRWIDTGTPVLLILTVRSESVGTDVDLAQWLESLQRESPTLHLSMDTLGHKDVAALVAHLAGSSLWTDDDDTQARTVMEFGGWLARKTGGHPRQLAVTIRMLLQESVLQVRPVSDASWAIDIPSMRHMEGFGRPGGDVRGSRPAEGAPPLGNFPFSMAAAHRRHRVLYPMPTVHTTPTLVSVS